MSRITFEEINLALDRCMAQHPPTGLERKLHHDANKMSDLWARMVLDSEASVEREDVKPAVLEAIGRWAKQGPASTGEA